MRTFLLSTLALGAVLGGIAPAEAAAVMIRNCSYTIMTPGTYVLAADLKCPSTGPAILVNANDVRLVLGDRTLDGQGTGADAVRVGAVTGLRVVGGTLTGFAAGMILYAPTGARVAGVNASGNRLYGILVSPGSTGNRLTGNTATGNGQADLYDGNLPDCANTWLDNTFVTDNEGDGPAAGCIR